MDQQTSNITSNDEANYKEDNFNMSFDEGNEDQDNSSEMEGEAEEPSSFLEENLKAVHENFEALNTILHESNQETPLVAEIVFSNFQEMMEIKMDLESKYTELGNLAGDLSFLYRDPEMRIQSSPTEGSGQEFKH